jgi:hypothetical protein
MSLEALQAWLRALRPPPRVDGVSMLDGYLTAIIIGPRAIPPDEWFVDLLGEHGHIAIAAGRTLSCSPFQAAGADIPCSLNELFSVTSTGQGRRHDLETTVDHALMRGLDTAGPVMRRGASSV